MSEDVRRTILIQLDTDTQPSVFDAVVAVDAGAEILLRHGGVTPEEVQSLIHGAIFTRGVAELNRTAVFIGGSNVETAEAILDAVRRTFFHDLRVSVMLDPNGSNTTAAAAVLAAWKSLGGNLQDVSAAVVAATGPVGQRVARLLARLGARVTVGSRQLDRAEALAQSLSGTLDRTIGAFASSSPEALLAGLRDAEIIIAAGAFGIQLIPASLRAELSRARVAIDLNAVPPAGIEWIAATDRQREREGIICWGALGVGGLKMKIHKRAIGQLFATRDQVLNAEEMLEIGRGLA